MCLATVGRIVALPADAPGTALVDLDGALREVSLVLLDVAGTAVAPGDWLLTHTGLAVERLDEHVARELVEQRRELRAVEEGGAP